MNKTLIEQYRDLHQKNPSYGNGATYLKHITEVINRYGFTTGLDFGCGKGYLTRELNKLKLKLHFDNYFCCDAYDPAIPEYSGEPTASELVIANDVLEHFEFSELESELTHVNNLATRAIFANISCRPAVHHLPDGRNCHTCVMPPLSWIEVMDNVFHDKVLVEKQYYEGNKNLRVLYVNKS